MQRNGKTDAEAQLKLMVVLSDHIGATQAIGMGELYEAVYGESWRNRINDTRKIRKLITAMRRDGVAICSASTKEGGGYYMASAGSELVGYLRRSRVRALRILARVAKIQKISLPDLLGQMKLEMEGGDEKAA